MPVFEVIIVGKKGDEEYVMWPQDGHPASITADSREKAILRAGAMKGDVECGEVLVRPFEDDCREVGW